MKTTWWESGDWNAICDVCGFKFKASQLRLRWDGLRVCDTDWESRHPQDLIRPIPDSPALPWTRPEGTDSFVTPSNLPAGCTILGTQSVAGVGVAGCMIAGRDLGIRATLAEVVDFH